MTKSKLYVYLDCANWQNNKEQTHREDGPAYEYANGTNFWYLNGLVNRVDGPACEYADGTKAWYLNGDHYTEKEYNAKIKSLR